MGMLKIFLDNEVHHPYDASLAVKELRAQLRHLLISKANFDKGSMRCKIDVALYKNEDEQPSRVSFRNIRSFEQIEDAIIIEVKRQSELLDDGVEVAQELRKFNPKTLESLPFRTE